MTTPTLTAELPLSHLKLYRRLLNFNFNPPGTEFTFVERLARENAWPTAYAERVLQEYLRFLYLACVAGHPVTPSDEVDQAWHLHLVYTQSYWQDLCANTLERPLHHQPTQGGAAEANKFYDWYENTLKSYQKEFGHPPPPDIWPDSATRFDPIHLRQRIRLADYRLIAIRSLKRFWFMIFITLTISVSLIDLVFIPAFFFLTSLVYILLSKRQCPRCHHLYALQATNIKHPNGKSVQFRCQHCQYTLWRNAKGKTKSSGPLTDYNETCGAGCGDGGGGDGGCGGGGCGGGGCGG